MRLHIGSALRWMPRRSVLIRGALVDSIPMKRKRILELFQNANNSQECLELIQADFLGHEVKEILFTRRLPKNPKLTDNLKEKG